MIIMINSDNKMNMKRDNVRIIIISLKNEWLPSIFFLDINIVALA